MTRSRALGISGLAGILLAVFALVTLPVNAAPGDLDTTFNTDGIFLEDLGPSDESMFDVVVQSDGKSVLAGYCQDGTGRHFCIVRLNEDGTYDADFDGDSGTGDGIVIVTIGSNNSYGTGVALEPDGDIVVSGYCSGPNGSDFCVVRLLEDGALDTTFGVGGRVIVEATADSDISPKVALQGDGKIVLAGECGGTPADFCVVRLLSGGALDTDFAVDGIRRVDFAGGSDNPQNLVVSGTEIVVVGGCHTGVNFDFCAIRLDAEGELDTDFDSDGILSFEINGNSETATGVAVDTLGRTIIGGHCGISAGIDAFCVARVLDDGSFDPDFDSDSGTADGRFTIDVGDYSDVAMDLVLQPDGKVVLAGYCDPDDDANTYNWDFCLVMLDEIGALETDFSGDGQVFTSIGTGGRANAIAFVPATPVSKLIAAGFCYDDEDNLSCAARYEGLSFDPDADNDGVLLPDDLCPNTGPGETVDEDGCSANDLAPEVCSGLNLTAVIEGTTQGETIKGTNANELILGNGGADTIYGYGGDDCIVGGDAIDRIDSGLGNDVILGMDDNDKLKGGNGNDTIYGGEGNDTIDGGNDDDVLHGNEGNDTINGGNGFDLLDGGEDNDTLNGGNNNDQLNGGPGTDKLNGSGGVDACTPLDAGGTRTLCESILNVVE